MVNINAYFKKSLKILWHNFFRFSLILFFSSSIIFFIWIFLIHRSTWKEVFLIGNLWVTYLPENQIFFLFVYDWPLTILSYSDVFKNYYFFLWSLIFLGWIYPIWSKWWYETFYSKLYHEHWYITEEFKGDLSVNLL